jgi:hypothetical protein
MSTSASIASLARLVNCAIVSAPLAIVAPHAPESPNAVPPAAPLPGSQGFPQVNAPPPLKPLFEAVDLIPGSSFLRSEDRGGTARAEKWVPDIGEQLHATSRGRSKIGTINSRQFAQSRAACGHPKPSFTKEM